MQRIKKTLTKVFPRFVKLKFVSFYLNDPKFRTKVSLLSSFSLNVLFSVFKFITGIIYHSLWFGAVGVYYFMLSLLRITTFKSVTDLGKMPEKERRIKEQYVGRIIGVFLLLLSIAMTGMALQMIYRNEPFVYPLYIVIIIAAYAAYRLFAAVTNLVRFRKQKQTVFTIAKAIDLASVFMAILSLQTAVLTRFGIADGLRRIINSLTGGAICIFTLLIAVSIIRKAQLRINDSKRITGEK